MVANLQVVTIALIMGAKLHGKPNFNVVELGLAWRVCIAFQMQDKKEKRISAMHKRVPAQKHIGGKPQAQLIAVLDATLIEALRRLTYIPLPADAVQYAVQAGTPWQEVNAIDWCLLKYCV